MFGTAGLMILIGAVLTIVLVGFILLWVAMILLAVAFFSIKTQPAQLFREIDFDKDSRKSCILLDQNSACAANCTRTHTNPTLNKLLTYLFPIF